ncbi:MAG: ATP-binding protein [Andreesenia angusta]|nr:ATP-binding protein [Andreesenia angusta]
MESHKLNIEMGSSLEQVKNEINAILVELRKSIKEEDVIFETRTILTELVINAIIHGNLLDESKKVQLEIFLENDEMKICVKDEGVGFEYCTDSYNVYDLNSNGRGLLIVKGLSDELNINKNKVSVRKSLKKE